MLSQYDRQQLELISSRLQMDDPGLAKALRDGKPRPLPVHRRWPYVVLGVLAALVFISGVLTAGVGLIFAGTLAMAGIVYWYRQQASRSPRVRRARRKRR